MKILPLARKSIGVVSRSNPADMVEPPWYAHERWLASVNGKLIKEAREFTRQDGSNVSEVHPTRLGIECFWYRHRCCRITEHRELRVVDCPNSGVAEIRYEKFRNSG